ncbi:MAG: fibronectin type III domain-containing protein [Gelidibacter sp.]
MNKLLLIVVFMLVGRISAQDLHNQANAASINNETNSTAGWSGSAAITSDGSDPQLGSFAIRAVSTSNNQGRTINYRFSAVIGQAYTVRIWAKYGPRVNNNSTGAFAVWTGLSGWSVTPITGTDWREYVFNVTATAANPTIVAYTSGFTGQAIPGNTILIDNVSILPAGMVDTEAPNPPSNLSANGTTATATNLSWTGSTDNVGVTGYTILQNGTSIGTTNGATTFNVTGLTQNTSYAFTVTARDAAGNVSSVSNVTNVTTQASADSQAPTAPSNLVSSSTTTTTTNLSWTASTDNVGVTGYTILQNGTSIGTTSGVTTFNVTGLTQNTPYAFTVTANDAAGNVSPVSNTANVTTQAAVDNQAPTAPSNLGFSGTTNTSTNLSWTGSTDNVAVTGYTIFQNGASVGSTSGTTSFTVTGLSQTTSYAFTVAASDAAGNVSPMSNTVNITTTGTGLVDYTSENSNLLSVDWTGRDLFAHRNVGIGTTNTHGYRLAVAGNMVAEEVNVKLKVNWPDYVFEKDYKLPSLKEVEEHIREKGYLLNMPSAKVVENEGIDLGKMNAKLLEKIEELTLYAIDQEKKIRNLEQDNKRIDSIAEKLMKLEQDFKENNK